MGLEGVVAKRRDSRYRSGRCREWIKIKNPAHPAIERAMLIALEQGKRGDGQSKTPISPPGSSAIRRPV
jgi:ATP-dependent DNA ligase